MTDLAAPSTDPAPAPSPRRRGGPLAAAREAVVVVVIALALSWLVKTFLLAAFVIPSASMQDTLLVGDRVVVSKLTPGPLALHRGDVVVFTDPGGWLKGDTADGRVAAPRRGPLARAVVAALGAVGVLPDDSHGHLVKRVIGLPGDRVSCRVGGLTHVDGHAVHEDYLAPGAVPCGQMAFSVRVQPGHVWVEGDNRQDSEDSRFHTALPGGGGVAERLVVGRAVARVWPLDRVGWLGDHPEAFSRVTSAG